MDTTQHTIPDLSVNFLGKTLPSPLVLASGIWGTTASLLVRAAEAGCGGIVCSAPDLHDVHEYAPRLHRVVPGIRPAGADVNDQARTATPREARDAGADLLVIGRPVTLADDPVAAAQALVAGLG